MKTLVILHGWQSSKEKWQKVKEILEKEGIKVIIPDLPGFKPETTLTKTWNLDDYIKWLKDFLFKKRTTCPELAEGFFLLGHSFGGRVAIKFAEKYPEKLKGLILVAAAGIKKKPSLFGKILSWGGKLVRKLKIEEIPLIKTFWKLFRKFFYCYILRKTDYFQTSGFLKETMKNILAEDLTPLLERISVQTLILWGKKDKITPLKDALLMKEKIKNSRLEVFEKIGHSLRRESPELLIQKIKEFIKI